MIEHIYILALSKEKKLNRMGMVPLPIELSLLRQITISGVKHGKCWDRGDTLTRGEP